MPPSLRQRLDECADHWLLECATQPGAGPRATRAGRLPWLLAAAAMLIAIAGWWPRLSGSGYGGGVAMLLNDWRVGRDRNGLLATAGTEHWAWGGDAATGHGDVVWDPRGQRGYLRLSGFVPNDPARAQYQLWIFDAARDDRYPVDGGVFDVPEGRSEVIVPVRPTRPVQRVVAFAVTVERPGGAVVSAREKVVAFARGGL